MDIYTEQARIVENISQAAPGIAEAVKRLQTAAEAPTE